MELLIHAGLNKAGSSYLQAILHANSAALREQHISYTGGTSKNGNATAMVLHLRAGNLHKVEYQLKALIEQARIDGAKKLLLSSEALYHDLVVPEHRQQLFSIFRETGLSRPHILLIFREPVAHSISAYSHRAGRKHAEEFLTWLNSSYEFPHELPRFLEMLTCEQDVDLMLKPYSNTGLDNILQDWLGPVTLPEKAPKTVNASPSLTEAEFLVRVRRVDIAMAERLRRNFKRIEKANKAPDTALRKSYEHMARSELVRLNPHLEKLSALVGTDLTVSPPGSVSAVDGLTVLSPAQVEAIAMACHSESFLIRRLKSAIKQFVRRV
ncbi:hypothetical protein SAMN04488512_12342 [Sulfitobacter litoralis]|uniref:Sulfotransferase family protein n=1 Tax=Sulfitobacter litoralis TaxID=335975 RepID=A0ABY0SUH6_9RHOB|nr:hypothetical protein [Sulfitobacter litoralis]SDP62275.1 hypothetical protein SAMN04488512_12342 [Sulfitobacter litoralis]